MFSEARLFIRAPSALGWSRIVVTHRENAANECTARCLSKLSRHVKARPSQTTYTAQRHAAPKQPQRRRVHTTRGKRSVDKAHGCTFLLVCKHTVPKRSERFSYLEHLTLHCCITLSLLADLQHRVERLNNQAQAGTPFLHAVGLVTMLRRATEGPTFGTHQLMGRSINPPGTPQWGRNTSLPSNTCVLFCGFLVISPPLTLGPGSYLCM